MRASVNSVLAVYLYFLFLFFTVTCIYKIGSSTTSNSCTPATASISTDGRSQLFDIPYSVSGTYQITVTATAVPIKSANIVLNVLGDKSCAIKSPNYPNLTTYSLDDVSLSVET